jgi:hypothetical protein
MQSTDSFDGSDGNPQVSVTDLNRFVSALSELTARFDAAMTPCSIGLIEARHGLARAISALGDEVEARMPSVE